MYLCIHRSAVCSMCSVETSCKFQTSTEGWCKLCCASVVADAVAIVAVAIVDAVAVPYASAVADAVAGT